MEASCTRPFGSVLPAAGKGVTRSPARGRSAGQQALSERITGNARTTVSALHRSDEAQPAWRTSLPAVGAGAIAAACVCWGLLATAAPAWAAPGAGLAAAVPAELAELRREEERLLAQLRATGLQVETNRAEQEARCVPAAAPAAATLARCPVPTLLSFSVPALAQRQGQPRGRAATAADSERGEAIIII